MLKIILTFLLSFNVLSNTIDINSGKFERIDYQENKISFNVQSDIENIKIKIKDDYSWVRINKSFILPKVNIEIESTNNYTYEYTDKTYYSQSTLDRKYTHFYVSPFLSSEILVFSEGELKGKIHITLKDYKNIYSIDKSCKSIELRVENKNTEPLLIGCSFYKKNDLKTLKIQFMHINSKAIKESYLDSNSILEYKKDNIDLKIQAVYQNKINNFVFALGLGPYALHTSLEDKNKDAISAAVMLYSNYKFTEDVSVRAFSASIFDVSSFHNFGIYLANNFAYLLDSDLVFTSLLGVQYLDYRFNSNSENYKSPLYPQGLEFTYKNLFKNKSYIISGGIFINPTSSSDYQNAWIRWGDKYFYELNYINWASDEFKANMWGLSLILPFK